MYEECLTKKTQDEVSRAREGTECSARDDDRDQAMRRTLGPPRKPSKHDRNVDVCEEAWAKHSGLGSDPADVVDSVAVAVVPAADRIDDDDVLDDDGHIDANVPLTNDLSLLSLMEFTHNGIDIATDASVMTLLRTRSRSRRDARQVVSPCQICHDPNLILRPQHEQTQHIARCKALAAYAAQ